MNERSYLDLTPKELRARRVTLCGLALVVMPPLLTLCHLDQYLCQASEIGDVAFLLTLWAVFPWMISVLLLMLGGLGIAVVGGILLLLARYSAGMAVDPIQPAAVRTS